MNRSRFNIGILVLFSACCVEGLINEINGSVDGQTSNIPAKVSPRIFFNGNSTLITIGVLPFAAGVAAAVALLILLFVPFIFSMFQGSSLGLTGGGYSAPGGSSYQSYARKASFNPYGIDWEKFTILDWISVAEDTWRNFQPSNLDCQKRLICELHQNTMRFGYVAKKMVDLFSYLEYAELLRLPEEAKTIIDDYMDAADRGRSLKKDCGDIYFGCDFSVKKIFDKVTDNEI